MPCGYTIYTIMMDIPFMWVKQCHKPPMNGNGNHTTPPIKIVMTGGWFMTLFYQHYDLFHYYVYSNIYQLYLLYHYICHGVYNHQYSVYIYIYGYMISDIYVYMYILWWCCIPMFDDDIPIPYIYKTKRYHRLPSVLHLCIFANKFTNEHPFFIMCSSYLHEETVDMMKKWPENMSKMMCSLWMFHQCYPLVNVNKKLWKDPPFSSWVVINYFFLGHSQ